MRLSEGVEWGLRAVVLLAFAPVGVSVPAARIAEFHGVPAPYLAENLQALARAGYRLARPAAEIRVLDVLEAIDGDDGAFRCTEIRRRGPTAVPAREYRVPCAIHAAMVRADAVAGHGAVVHLATSVPPLAKMGRRRAWATNDRLRVDATRNLIAGARRHGIDRFVKESITFPYADGGDGWLDEDAPVDPAVAWRATLEGERSVRELGAEGAAAVVLRFGLLYAADARSTDEYRTLARLRVAPVPGRPGAFVSSIHADDAAAAAEGRSG